VQKAGCRLSLVTDFLSSSTDSFGTLGSILSMDVRDAQLGYPSKTLGRTGV
jgi:hypothetical protein